jgi:hypothetical protein
VVTRRIEAFRPEDAQSSSIHDTNPAKWKSEPPFRIGYAKIMNVTSVDNFRRGTNGRFKNMFPCTYVHVVQYSYVRICTGFARDPYHTYAGTYVHEDRSDDRRSSLQSAVWTLSLALTPNLGYLYVLFLIFVHIYMTAVLLIQYSSPGTSRKGCRVAASRELDIL